MINRKNPFFYLNILVIDDEQDFLDKFRETVRSFGHVMVGIKDPGEAISRVEESYALNNPFDVVFVDFLLPYQNGVEVALKLKEIDPELLLIAITRDLARKTKLMIIDSLAFELLVPKNMPIPKVKRLFDILIATKLQQNSGMESRMAKKQQHDQMKAEEKRRKRRAKKVLEKVDGRVTAKTTRKSAKKTGAKTVKKGKKKPTDTAPADSGE